MTRLFLALAIGGLLAAVATAQPPKRQPATLEQLIRQAAAQAPLSDPVPQPLSVLQQTPQTPQLTPEIVAELSRLLSRQAPQPQVAATPELTPEMIALIRALMTRRQLVVEEQVPEVDVVHNYQLPAILDPPPRQIHISKGRQPRVLVELVKPQNCCTRFFRNFINMFLEEPACVNRCGLPAGTCDCQ